MAIDANVWALASDRIHRLLLKEPLAREPVDVNALRRRLAAAIAQAIEDEEVAIRRELFT